MKTKIIKLKNFNIADPKKLTLITGPCVIENLDHALKTCEFLKNFCESLNISFIYKSSFDKANRSSLESYRGPGFEEGLNILHKVKITFDVPILTDIHLPSQAEAAANVCDIIQIPAFLCRQTDLLIAAGQTKSIVNVKRGQFMAPWDMANVISKILSTGNDKIILTDRGSCFGYNNLVSDMRSIPIMQKLGYPVCFDATHSVQLPGGLGTSTDGQREFIPILSQAAIAAGCNLLYMESHNNPDKALCDKKSVIAFKDLKALFEKLIKIYEIVHN